MTAPRYIETQIAIPPDGRRWRTVRYDLERSADLARYVARERYAWPGGYELFAVCEDGAVLCKDCCRAEYATIARNAHPGSGWRLIGLDTAETLEEPETCAHCSATIPRDD